ncbi:tetratricopeptide repeat protein [Patiriisocius marinus]|uniref:Uncharacterized protein n=1 Tax=Patiriisocius marinus TaxID=1397112 RepID=A0A5J4IMP0_9FLAO|nr:tetratricopeptide repeat protein [Patiriisocius marinus]GER58529.1 hypothetical protein ULMA_06370 [Patiriisocius marinus]
MNKSQQQYISAYFFGNLTASQILFCLVIVLCVLFPKHTNAQTTKEVKVSEEAKKELLEVQTYLSEASEAITNDKFVEGEADYRKAISINEKESTGNYNLGTAYYKNNLKAESLDRFKKAALTATEKPERHRAFHNLGNALMDKKDYAGAVDAYKNALRNNPTDDETRYNLAVAKDLLEKNPPEGGGGDDENEDENNDDQDKKEQQDQKDKEDKKDGEDGKDKDEQDKGDEKDKDKEGDNEDKGKPEEPKDDNQEKQGDEPQQQQPVPGKLSPQEVKNLLESMNNEEKKVQDKINAQKQKGAKVKSEKDW